MKQQVSRFSPHQNAKVFAVLKALSSFVLIVPFALVANAFSPNGASMLAFLVMPVIYLVFGYLSVVIGCLFYNYMFRFIGGIEFESKGDAM